MKGKGKWGVGLLFLEHFVRVELWLSVELDEGPLYVCDLNSEDGCYRRQCAKKRCQICNQNRVLGKVSLINLS